jgi:WD40 repeat protein
LNGEARDLLVLPHDPKDPFLIAGLTWAPDGRELLLIKGGTKNDEPNTEIWRLPVGGSAIRKFTLSMDRVRDLRVHPDGKRIAFTSCYQKVEVWTLENIPPAPQPRRSSVSRRFIGHNSTPEWSPD